MKQAENKSRIVSLFDRLLDQVSHEVERLPETLEQVPPEKRLEFVSRTIPMLCKFRETEREEDPLSFSEVKWGD